MDLNPVGKRKFGMPPYTELCTRVFGSVTLHSTTHHSIAVEMERCSLYTIFTPFHRGRNGTVLSLYYIRLHTIPSRSKWNTPFHRGRNGTVLAFAICAICPICPIFAQKANCSDQGHPGITRCGWGLGGLGTKIRKCIIGWDTMVASYAVFSEICMILGGHEGVLRHCFWIFVIWVCFW